MTIKEAILLSLEDFPYGAIMREVYDNILKKNIFKFSKEAQTPDATVSALLGDMIRKGDVRIKRFKNDKNIFCYYLSKYSENIENRNSVPIRKKKSLFSFNERELHSLLCSYLNYNGIIAKTIFHEKSCKAEEHQKWIHPDIVGVKFIEQKNPICNSLYKVISKKDSLHLYSYELKKKIENDYDLKKCFFQAVSNSSWSNYGYLVSFDMNTELKDELARLNHSFGIGFILLKANPYESQVWFEAKTRRLDFTTIDKLCEINSDFKEFIKLVEAILTADDKHFNPSKAALINICDRYPSTDSEIQKYCEEHYIPLGNEEIE
ncbi:hypothetical protein [Hoylesella saccharolytica]|uniref:hypothetical protein n=1 Tax=Hoylesella saccharolytica TaxID=633701 RepID=UPI0028E8026F|nr:hypothetical protein [Hoylesella saccharolytica]